MGDNLRRGGFDFVDWCIMCCRCGEMVDHLLLHCEMAHWLWSFVFTSFGFLWVIPRMILDLLFGWWNWLGKHLSNIWNLVLLCLLWCLWKEWNQQTFKDLDLDSSGDQMLLLVELYLTDLGHGDSQLVLLSLLFLAFFSFVIDLLPGFLLFLFSFFLFL